MRRLAISLIDFLEKKGALRHSEKDVYIYGADIILYTIMSTLGLVIAGVIWRRIFESCIIIIVFYYNQSMGGGYHANTHAKCFFTMLIGMLCALTCLSLPEWFFGIMGLISIMYLYYVPLVISKNRTYLIAKKQALTTKALKALSIESVIYILILIIEHAIIWQAFSLGLCVSAISRFIGKSMQLANEP